MIITNYDIYCILVNNEIFANVLFYNAYVIMRLASDKLKRLDSPLVSFFEDAIPTEGVVTISMIVSRYS